MTARAFAFFSGLADGKPLVEVAFRGLDRYYLSTQLRRKYISRLASSSVAAAERTATLLVGNKISLTNEERKKLEDTVEASGNPSASCIRNSA